MISYGGALARERVKLDRAMVTNEAAYGAPEAMVDEQEQIKGDPPTGEPTSPWTFPSQHWKGGVTPSAYLDLGRERYLASLWIYDTNGVGDLVIASGRPGEWKEERVYDCKAYKRWVEVPLAAKTRFVHLTRKDGGSNFTEIVLFEQTAQEFADAKAKAEAEAKAKAERAIAEAKAKAEREAGVAKAKLEAKTRPVVDLGAPFGKATLVDEIDAAAQQPGHLFTDSPAGASRIETILGKPCRTLKKTPGEAAYMAFRIGQYKLLKPGAAYVLAVEYPEDAPRSAVVLNSGNESALGFYTGAALGDAFHPKYVNNLNESLTVPLSGKYQTWTQFFNLHSRFCNIEYPRGDGARPLSSDDGFTVTIAQFSAENLPVSQGAAVSRIRLYELAKADAPTAYRLPPDGLPRRHIFWREEMADNVIAAEKQGKPGVDEPLDWYRYKANQMQWLGINTYTKDLLEFGAVQHWDSTPYGGHAWCYFNSKQKDLWGQIVQLMGERGFSVLPYYEYAGSKGQQGLGNKRRAKPLTRDDAFTHITWVESSNADITDPDAYADFKKMLDLTVVQFKDKAPFVGAWLRPRSQLPMGFGDATRARFAAEANGGREVTRKDLREDRKLLTRYENWWFEKRRAFLTTMRDYLRDKGVKSADVLYTTAAGEPGVGFPTWDPLLVTDDVAGWKQRLAAATDEKDRKIKPLAVTEVAANDMYLKALTSPQLTWGGWEWQYASPQADPQNYQQTDGVLLTHAINRLYTVSSPKTFDAFRGPSGLAVVRHYTLNENMMFDKADKPKLGYFAADIERAGPYCMMAEAVAVANGDPRYLGYLVGRTYVRGFPQYVRNFNAAFLSLPALPSRRLPQASSDPEVVVREIVTPKHGTYYAVVNIGMKDKPAVDIRLPAGKITDAATGESLTPAGGKLPLTLYPFQLRALHVVGR